MKAQGCIEREAPNFQNAAASLAAFCVAELEASISSLLETLAAERQASRQIIDDLTSEVDAATRVLSDAVIAFHRSETNPGACPRNWSLYKEAGGRMIIGAGNHSNAGLTVYPSFVDNPAGATGGEENVTLSVAQMPAHRHGIPMVTAPHGYLDIGLGTNAPYFDYKRRSDVATKIGDSRPDQGVYASGGNQPHNNMPPYIALYYCKKD